MRAMGVSGQRQQRRRWTALKILYRLRENPQRFELNTDDDTGRILTIDGTIAEESWFDDDIPPKPLKTSRQSG